MDTASKLCNQLCSTRRQIPWGMGANAVCEVVPTGFTAACYCKLHITLRRDKTFFWSVRKSIFWQLFARFALWFNRHCCSYMDLFKTIPQWAIFDGRMHIRIICHCCNFSVGIFLMSRFQDRFLHSFDVVQDQCTAVPLPHDYLHKWHLFATIQGLNSFGPTSLIKTAFTPELRFVILKMGLLKFGSI